MTCNNPDVTILGTNGPDTITGTEKPDVIHGLGGNDRIDAGRGAARAWKRQENGLRWPRFPFSPTGGSPWP